MVQEGSPINDTLLTKPNQIASTEDAMHFISWARGLGETVSPKRLAELRTENLQVLNILADNFAKKKPLVNEGRWTVIIPAYKEKDIGKLLGELVSQISLMPKDNTIGFAQAEIIISINNEDSGGITEQAVNKFLDEHNLPERVSVKILTTKQQGKLVAFDSALNYLEMQQEFPQYLFFFDADSKIKSGCLAALHNILLYRIQAAGARIVPQEPVNIREALAGLPTKGHGREGVSWLQGGHLQYGQSLHLYITLMLMLFQELLRMMLTGQLYFIKKVSLFSLLQIRILRWILLLIWLN